MIRMPKSPEEIEPLMESLAARTELPYAGEPP